MREIRSARSRKRLAAGNSNQHGSVLDQVSQQVLSVVLPSGIGRRDQTTRLRGFDFVHVRAQRQDVEQCIKQGVGEPLE
jgi:hypothetical protein